MSKLREQVSLSSNDPSGIEEIKKVLSEDKHGECYKEIYSDFKLFTYRYSGKER